MSAFAGYAEEAPCDSEEEELLSQLVDSCLGCTPEEAEKLLTDLSAMSRTQGQCREAQVADADIKAVSARVSSAVRDLKHKARPLFDAPMHESSNSVHAFTQKQLPGGWVGDSPHSLGLQCWRSQLAFDESRQTWLLLWMSGSS